MHHINNAAQWNPAVHIAKEKNRANPADLD
jgi:hypothetical protein